MLEISTSAQCPINSTQREQLARGLFDKMIAS